MPDICYHCTACDARGYGQVCWICGEAGHLVCLPLGVNGAFGPDYDNDDGGTPLYAAALGQER